MMRIIAVGGSLISPNQPDEKFIKSFAHLVRTWLNQDKKHHLALVVGGGGAARLYQETLRRLHRETSDENLDWIGIRATRLNAELVRLYLADLCPSALLENPLEASWNGSQLLVAGGWKPGFSTDYVAVALAERLQAQEIIVLSNIDYIYSKDPKKDPHARALKKLTWEELSTLVGDTWTPGIHLPFDPIATREARRLGLKLYFASGEKLETIEKLLHHDDFEGTSIFPSKS